MSRAWSICAGLALPLCACVELKAPADAPIDASADASGPPLFCDKVVPVPDFCNDFDHSPRVVDGWDNANKNPDNGASGGGSITAEVVSFHSPPRAAALAIPALVDSTRFASAILAATLKKPLPTDLTFEMEIMIETEYFGPNSGVVDLAVISYGGKPELSLLRRDSGTWLTVGSTTGVKLTVPLVVGAWTTLGIVLQNRPVNGTGDGRIQIFVDHVRAADVALPARLQSTNEQNAYFGPVAKGPVGAFRMVLDNFRVWRRSDL